MESGRFSEAPVENKNEMPYTFRSKRSALTAMKAKQMRESDIKDDEDLEFMHMGPGADENVHLQDDNQAAMALHLGAGLTSPEVAIKQSTPAKPPYSSI